jgi:glycine cleavage system H lipoate-binding protein
MSNQVSKKTLSKLSNPIHGSGWIVQVQPTQARAQMLLNPTHGSGWIVQVQPTGKNLNLSRRDLNNPPTAVGGIQTIHQNSV